MSFVDDVKNYVEALWDDFVEFFTDLPLVILDSLLSAIAFAVDLIPLPDFLTDFSLSSVIHEDLVWFLAQSGFGPALGIVGGAYVFYFIRRLTTIGIW